MAGKRKRSIRGSFHFITGGWFESDEERLRRQADEVSEIEARELVERTARMRAVFAAVPTLGTFAAILPEGVVVGRTMLSAGLGYFDLPKIDAEFLLSPKGFMLTTSTRFLVEPQRSTLAAEFLKAMCDNASNHERFGVLLSGPAGVGKTAVGILSFAYCFARGLPCVYIPDAGEWIGAAQQGLGDEYFLRAFLRQNADLVMADPTLMKAFAASFAGAPLNCAVMTRLLDVLRARPGPAVGCIVDEVQKITAAVAAGLVPGAVSEERRAAVYFQQWQNWVNRYQLFVRMDIASSHGARELKITGGEETRLRFMRPWPPAECSTFCAAPLSPLYIANLKTRARLLIVCGGILCLVYKAVRDIACAVPLESLERGIRNLQLECCQRWFDTLSEPGKKAAASSMLALVRGEVLWDRVKGLYDDGIVARFDESSAVKPVSPIAASVVFEVMSTYGRGNIAQLTSFDDGAPRGIEFERQLLLCLAPVDIALSDKSLNATACPSVYVRTDVAIPLTRIEADLVLGYLPLLLFPLSKQFPCDAITLPACDSLATAPVILWECSVTDPRESSRIAKVMAWFAAGGIISQLRAKFARRPVVCALCWNAEVAADSRLSSYKKIDSAAAVTSRIHPLSPVTVVVLGAASLRMLGVRA